MLSFNWDRMNRQDRGSRKNRKDIFPDHETNLPQERISDFELVRDMDPGDQAAISRDTLLQQHSRPS